MAEQPTKAKKERQRRLPAIITPRVLSDEQAAVYLGVSPGFIRWLIGERKLQRVELPSMKHDGESARRLLDVPPLLSSVSV